MKITLKKYRALLFLSSAWMMAIGLRFMLMTEEAYFINLFDKFLDWGGLFLFGLALLIWSLYDFWKSKEKLCIDD